MKIGGHPIHLMLVHFPSALLPMEFVCSVAAWWMEDSHFLTAAFYAMAGAVLPGWMAAVFGAVDLAGWMKKPEPVRSAAMKRGWIHGGIQLTVLTVYSVLLARQWQAYPDLTYATVPQLGGKGILILAMLTGNYFGGELVLKYWDRDEKVYNREE